MKTIRSHILRFTRFTGFTCFTGLTCFLRRDVTCYVSIIIFTLLCLGCEDERQPPMTPVIDNLTVTDITESSAKCTFTIDPVGAAQKAGVIFGTDASLQSETTEASTTNITGGSISLTMSSLHIETMYYYKAYITDKHNSFIYSDISQFETKPLQFDISVTSIPASYQADSYRFNITSNVPWTIISDKEWCTVQPPSGNGNQEITATVTENTTETPRTATLTIIAGNLSKQVTVEQDKDNTTLDVSASKINAPYTAGQHSFTITSNAEWTIASDQEWCTVQPTSGDSNQEITVTVIENTTETPRSATLTITAGKLSKQVTVEQDKDNTELEVSVITMNVPYMAGQHLFTISSNAEWTITSNQDWCTVQPTSGNGNREIAVLVTENSTESPRIARLTITAGNQSKQVTIEQSIDNTALEVSVTTINAPYTASQHSFTITSNVEWTITSDQNWCTVQPTSGNGNREIVVFVTENSIGSPRTAILTITAGNQSKQVTIEQNIDNTVLEVSVNTINAPYTAGQHSFTITSNVEWTITSDQDWCTVQPISGNGNREIVVFVTDNSAGSHRTARLTINAGNQSKQVTIEQNIDNTVLEVSVTTINAPYTAGQHLLIISSNSTWTIESDQNWCTVQPTSGTGNREITVSVTENTTETPRTTILIIKAGNQSKQVNVIQERENTFLNTDVNTINAPYTAGQHLLIISSNSAWTIESDQNWCTVEPKSGNGYKDITVSVAENTTGIPRTAKLTVTAGKLSKQVNIEQDKDNTTLNVSVSTINASYSAGQHSFQITTNVAWTITSDQNWCNIQPANGDGNATIAVSVTENTTGMPRTATLTVNAGNLSKQVKVEQDIDNTMLNVSVVSINASYSVGQYSFHITSNVAWTITSDQNWCSVQPTSANGNSEILVHVTENNTGIPRTATLTVTAGTQSKQVKVEQDKDNTELFVSVSNINLPYMAVQHVFNITSNAAWTITSDQNWCNVQPTSGNGNRVITVSVTENATTTPRNATLTVIAGNMSIEVTVEQDTKGSPEFGNGIVAAENFGGGDGTQGSPYLIYNARQLKKLVDDVNNGNSYSSRYFKLLTDIQVTAYEWIPIGFNEQNKFSGFFDGDGHAIRGTLKSDKYSYFGFIGVASNARISNLTIEATVNNEGDSTFDYTYTGAIVGRAYQLVIINLCNVNGSVTGGIALEGTNTGGIAGYGERCTIQNCIVNVNITGGQLSRWAYTGGIFGGLFGGSITNCSASGKIVGGGTTSFTGGITGNFVRNLDDIGINNCTNQAIIIGGGTEVSYTGGIVGKSTSDIESCTVYSSGTITGGGGLLVSYTGGIVGEQGGSFAEIILKNCVNHAMVTVVKGEENISNFNIGGIAGKCSNGNIINCTVSSTGTITGKLLGGYIGGITGFLENSSSRIINCTNNAAVSLEGYTIGGLVGINHGIIHSSLNTGNISGGTFTGGLVGDNYEYTVDNHIYSCCTNLGTVNGQAANENNQIGHGKTVEPCPDGHTKR